MKFAAEGAMAIPLWINGRAYLTVTEGFVDVCDAHSGEVLRRTPLAGQAEVAAAVSAMEMAAPAWRALGVAGRQAYLEALARLLDQYTGHFAGLIVQEAGGELEAARAQVETAVAALRGEEEVTAADIGALIADASVPFSTVVAGVAATLRAGGVLVLKPSPKAPGALFALAELSGRADWPPGVWNLVHGDLAAVEALCVNPGIASRRVLGEPGFLSQVEEVAAKQRRH